MDLNDDHRSHSFGADLSKRVCGGGECRTRFDEIIDEHDIGRTDGAWIYRSSCGCMSITVSEGNILQLRTRGWSKQLEQRHPEGYCRRPSELERKFRRRRNGHHDDVGWPVAERCDRDNPFGEHPPEHHQRRTEVLILGLGEEIGRSREPIWRPRVRVERPALGKPSRRRKHP